jgi:predicted nucleic acid-binding Zn ribbon protein
MKLSAKITPLGGAIDFALREYGLEKGVRGSELFLRWQEITGPAVASRTQPIRLVDGVLHVRADDPVWRQELILRREELRRLINSALKEPMIVEIVVR